MIHNPWPTTTIKKILKLIFENRWLGGPLQNFKIDREGSWYIYYQYSFHVFRKPKAQIRLWSIQTNKSFIYGKVKSNTSHAICQEGRGSGEVGVGVNGGEAGDMMGPTKWTCFTTSWHSNSPWWDPLLLYKQIQGADPKVYNPANT